MTHQVVRYKDVEARFPGLKEPLYEFCKSLYSQELLGLAALKKHIGDLKDHYDQFVPINNVGKCPFCGMNDLKSVYHSKREAYDHYLPKSIYPFNSINFFNLAPACHECNSTYKSTKDPTFEPKDKLRAAAPRKAFYPYSTAQYQIEISVTLKHNNLDTLQPDDIDLKFGPATLQDELDTWQDVYGLQERYRAKFCDGDAKDWIETFRIANRRSGTSPQEFIETMTEGLAERPYANLKFLKKAFLEEAHRIGALDAIATHQPQQKNA